MLLAEDGSRISLLISIAATCGSSCQTTPTCSPNLVRWASKDSIPLRISGAGLRESHVHDVIITREAPNYALE